MSSMDLFEDGFPHSTAEGYEKGCRGQSCPGKLDYGFTCSEAFSRSRGDFRYQRLVAEGMSPAEIAEVERPAAPVEKRKRTQREKDGKLTISTAPSVTVADSEEPIVEKPKRARLVEAKPAPERKPIEHGTPKGYGRGCRDDCPGDASGVTCREAMNTYLREYKARRVANGGEKLGQATRPGAAKPRERKLAETPVRVQVKALFSPTPESFAGKGSYKAVSFVLLRNGAVRDRKFHQSWAAAMEHAWAVVAEHRQAAS